VPANVQQQIVAESKGAVDEDEECPPSFVIRPRSFAGLRTGPRVPGMLAKDEGQLTNDGLKCLP